VAFGSNGLLVYGTTGYQFDPQGNAVHLMDDDGLTVLANLAYDAWGQRMSGSNPTPYGYKGQWGYYTDVETGILLLTHRYFDSATGRFLTRDPIGFDGGINLYAYVGNGVVRRQDRLGLKVDWCEGPPKFSVGSRVWLCCDETKTGEKTERRVCLGFTPSGKWCTSPIIDEGLWETGDLAPPHREGERCRKVNLTPEQEKCVCGNMKRPQRQPPLYCLVGNNCYDVAQWLLEQCGYRSW